MKSLLTCLLLSCATLISATITELSASKDNTLFETNAKALSNGAGDHIFIGRTNQADGLQFRRAVIHFDFSTIPDGSIINQVTLELTVNRYRAIGDINIHLAESDWGEGTSNAGGSEGSGTTATLNDATWVNAFHGNEQVSGIPWNNVGGDYAANASATSSFTGEETVSFSGQNLINDVQNWLDNINENYGWFVIGNESSQGTAVRISSRENLTDSPKLIIDYTPPPIEVQLTPVKDNTLYETLDGSLSNGAGTALYFGKTGGGGGNALRRALMQFDVSGIPAIASISEVTLHVQVSDASNQGQNLTAELKRLTADWGEGTSSGSGSGANSTTNDATWIHQFYDQSLWMVTGGEFSAFSSGTADFTTSDSETVLFSSTTELVLDVQNWVSGIESNFGWILIGDEINNANTRGIGSRESANPPVLTVKYVIPDLIFEDGFE